MADSKRLARLHRVRTLQLGLAQADEARAHAAMVSETQLSQRIAQLAAAVAPIPAHEGATTLAAAAYFREKLHRSSDAAAQRVRAAEAQAERRAEATRAARRDQTAIEKLIARDREEDVRAAIKALQDAPPTGPSRRPA